ncbi:response regulator [Candidatus Wolfebacteria bacterium]|nr:response regulator [Candidatus Wolfebacteria bacterium]
MEKILVVEDDQFLASLLKNRLQKEGFDVLLAKDGEEALDILESTQPELVLLDIILPKKSGFEVMEEVRENPKLEKLAIVIISNLGQSEDMIRGQQLGAIEYFVKAKTPLDELIKKIKEIIQSA